MGILGFGKKKLNGRKIAILATYGVEQIELTSPRKALIKEGAIVHVISPHKGIKGGKIKAWNLVDFEKPVSSICHGPWMLIEAGVANGRTLTSWPSLKTDLRNAGADWVNEKVVQDGNLVTSRGPQDLSAFNKKIIQLFSQAGAAQGILRRAA
jgi:protease I